MLPFVFYCVCNIFIISFLENNAFLDYFEFVNNYKNDKFVTFKKIKNLPPEIVDKFNYIIFYIKSKIVEQNAEETTEGKTAILIDIDKPGKMINFW